MAIRILVADDHPVVREGLVAVLSTQPDFEVVGAVGSGEAAIAQAKSAAPDLIMLDLEMPEMDGVMVLRHLQALGLPIRVIVFTAFDTDERILGAVQAGAKGYLLKGAPRDEIFHAIRVVHAGGSLLQPAIASRLMQQAANNADPLTSRELEVLHLMARGLQNKEIAGELVITERTVKFHVSAILGKLNAGNRTEAVRIAAQKGLISL